MDTIAGSHEIPRYDAEEQVMSYNTCDQSNDRDRRQASMEGRLAEGPAQEERATALAGEVLAAMVGGMGQANDTIGIAY